MFGQSFHRLAGLTAVVAALAVLAFSASAGASTGSAKTALAPAATRSANGVTIDNGAKKRPKKHPKKHGMGALRPKKQVDAIMPVGADAVTLPASIDLSTNDVPVGNQGSVGSCVSWAIDYAMLGWYATRDGRADRSFNPMYTYSQTHLSSTANDGGGSRPEDALRIAGAQGNDTMAHYHTQSTTDFVSQPNSSDVANASKFKIAGWQTLFANTSGTGAGSAGAVMIETALAQSRPVAITMRVRPGFTMWNKVDFASATDDDVSGTVTGAHEILAVGYDSAGLWIQNSWGTAYGYKGYSRLSWRVVNTDVYAAHTISGFAASNNNTTTDTTPPTMGAVNKQFVLGQQMTSTTAPVNFTWSASDPSGIGAYVVYVKTDGGQYTLQNGIASTATQYTFALSIGHSYQVAIAAKDGAGNWSSYSYSTLVTPSAVDDTAFSVSSPWARYSTTDMFGSSYMYAAQAGAWLQQSFTGTDIALIAPRFSSSGRATIYCDGSPVETRDFYSASTLTRQVAAGCHFTQNGQHTIKIVNEGTAGRPYLTFDAFAII